MPKALCPGTFDPITNGHIDIIKRAASIFDEVIVAVAKNSFKNPLFAFPERFALAKNALKDVKGIKVVSFDGLVVDFARKNNAKVIIRGLRMLSDFEYEFQMALTNRSLDPGVETIFLMPHPQYSYISSRLIKEAGSLGAELKQFLPVAVQKALAKRMRK